MTAPFDLAGRVVVVTGGLGQLGRSFTRALIGAGARVAVLDSADEAAGKGAFAGLEKSVLVCRADVTKRASLEAALAKIERQWETPYGLINNAAIDSPPDAPAGDNGPFENFSEATFERVMDVNVKGVLLCCQVIGGAMAKAGRGSIVNIGSIYGSLAPDQSLYEFRRKGGEEFFKPVAYSVSKSALLNLTRYLAVYWGGKSVRVNTLTFAGVFADQHPDFLERYVPKVALGRMAKPDDYDGAVIFLMSDGSRYMTGSNMTIDGGFSAM